MDNIMFQNLEELKQRLMPALKLRKRELKKQGIFLDEEKIWFYLAENIWKKAIGLSLARMVDDIFNAELPMDLI